jgi:hypothetical protein
MARPKRIDAGERRTAFLGIWLTPTELAELRTIATEQGASLSEFGRELLFRRAAAVVALTRRNPEAAAIMRELNDIGNNLNQIARVLNTTGAMDDYGRLVQALAWHKQGINRVLSL